MEKRSTVFIVNPKAGNLGIDMVKYLNDFIDKNNLNAKIEQTQYKDHASTITRDYLSQNFTDFVIVGGDGSVNEVASNLINTTGVLSIIPTGSGNGLARALNIPVDLEKSLEVYMKNINIKIDVGVANDKLFFCTAGIGFEAKCAYDFANATHNRGLWNYVKIIFNNYFKYKTPQLIVDNKPRDVFSITFANANQYGNNAFIAPGADLSDQLLECTLIKPHPAWYGGILAYKLMNKSIYNSKYVNHGTKNNFTISAQEPILMHIDGDSLQLETNTLQISMLPLALNVNHKP